MVFLLAAASPPPQPGAVRDDRKGTQQALAKAEEAALRGAHAEVIVVLQPQFDGITERGARGRAGRLLFDAWIAQGMALDAVTFFGPRNVELATRAADKIGTAELLAGPAPIDADGGAPGPPLPPDVKAPTPQQLFVEARKMRLAWHMGDHARFAASSQFLSRFDNVLGARAKDMIVQDTALQAVDRNVIGVAVPLSGRFEGIGNALVAAIKLKATRCGR